MCKALTCLIRPCLDGLFPLRVLFFFFLFHQPQTHKHIKAVELWQSCENLYKPRLHDSQCFHLKRRQSSKTGVASLLARSHRANSFKLRILNHYRSLFFCFALLWSGFFPPSLGHKISPVTWQWPQSYSQNKLPPFLATGLLFLRTGRHEVRVSMGNLVKGSSDGSVCNTWLTVAKHLVYLAQSRFQQRFPVAGFLAFYHPMWWAMKGKKTSYSWESRRKTFKCFKKQEIKSHNYIQIVISIINGLSWWLAIGAGEF